MSLAYEISTPLLNESVFETFSLRIEELDRSSIAASAKLRWAPVLYDTSDAHSLHPLSESQKSKCMWLPRAWHYPTDLLSPPILILALSWFWMFIFQDWLCLVDLLTSAPAWPCWLCLDLPCPELSACKWWIADRWDLMELWDALSLAR